MRIHVGKDTEYIGEADFGGAGPDRDNENQATPQIDIPTIPHAVDSKATQDVKARQDTRRTEVEHQGEAKEQKALTPNEELKKPHW